ncbi:STAS domain-containing protein [Rhodanobacter sp. Col0626]|uniref:STAS domain-containing protein n=1 Tax=Rhodanobacter sp. Col0626 TaxID=3415679 RepID=UPI003CE68044
MAGKRAAKDTGEEQAVAAVVVLPSDCRMAALAALQAELSGPLEIGAVVLDGQQVERIDTAVLQLLMLFRRELVARGGTLAWRGASDVLNEAASLLGLTKILELPAPALA